MQLLTKNNNGETSSNKRLPPQVIIMLLIIGVLFMLVGNLFKPSPSEDQASLAVFKQANDGPESVETFGRKDDGKATTISDYEDRYENQLKETLEAILGVKNVTVMVNVDATETKILDKNTVSQSQVTDEMDREGGKRKVDDQSAEQQTVIVRQGEKENPIIIKTEKPKIRGVLVVADGAQHIQIKKWIIEAVTRSLDVPAHRVSVLPKKPKGE